MVPIAVCEEVGMLPDLPAKSAYSIRKTVPNLLCREVEMCLLGVGKGVPRKMPLPIHYNGEMCMSVSG